MAEIDLGKYQLNLELNDSNFTSGMEKADQATEGFKGKLGGLTSFLKMSVVGGLAAVAVALGGIAVAGVKATAELDEQMSKFSASTGVVGEEAEKIRDIAKDLFKTNTDSMEDIVATSEALKQSMGLSVEEIGKFQQKYMDYAKTTGQNNADVVRAIDDIGDAWNLTAEDSANALDLLKLSSEQFGTDITSVQTALNQVAPSAKALGLSFEEANGYMNMFAAAGLDATSATTAFTYAAKQVKSPDEFKKLLSDIQSIEDPTLRAQKAVELFGSRAGVSLANVLDGSKNIDEFLVSMQEAEGTVNKASAAFDDNFNVQWTLAKKHISSITQGIGEQLMPTISKGLKLVTDNMPQITAAIEGTFKVVGGIIDFIGQAVSKVVEFFGTFKSENDSTFSGILATITEVLVAVQSFIMAFIGFVSGIWSKYGEDILSITQKYFEMVWKNIEFVLNIIKGVFDFFSGLFTGDWEKMGNALKDIIGNIWGLIANVFESALSIIKDILALAGKVLLDLGTAAMNGLWNAFKSIWDQITTWFSDILNGLFSWFESKFSGFKDIGSSMFNAMWEGLKGVWTNISSWISDTVSWLQDKLFFWRQSQTEMSSGGMDDYGYPIYHSGTPFVPSEWLALLARGEAVIPAAFNPWNPNNSAPAIAGVSGGDNFYVTVGEVRTNDARAFLKGIEMEAKRRR